MTHHVSKFCGSIFGSLCCIKHRKLNVYFYFSHYPLVAFWGRDKLIIYYWIRRCPTWMVFRKGRSRKTTLIRKYKRRTRTLPHLCIFKQPSTLVGAVNSLLLSFERKSERVSCELKSSGRGRSQSEGRRSSDVIFAPTLRKRNDHVPKVSASSQMYVMIGWLIIWIASTVFKCYCVQWFSEIMDLM